MKLKKDRAETVKDLGAQGPSETPQIPLGAVFVAWGSGGSDQPPALSLG